MFAIGAPRGLELTLSNGIISQLRVEKNDVLPMIQTTAAISPGSSGGGLFDLRGNLIGLTTSQLKDAQSLNFAIPVDWVLEALERHKLSSKASLDGETAGKSFLLKGFSLNLPCNALLNAYRLILEDGFRGNLEGPDFCSSEWKKNGHAYLARSQIEGTEIFSKGHIQLSFSNDGLLDAIEYVESWFPTSTVSPISKDALFSSLTKRYGDPSHIDERVVARSIGGFFGGKKVEVSDDVTNFIWSQFGLNQEQRLTVDGVYSFFALSEKLSGIPGIHVNAEISSRTHPLGELQGISLSVKLQRGDKNSAKKPSMRDVNL